MESDIRFDIMYPKWRPWRHFTEKSAATWWVNTKRLPGAYIAASASFLSIVYSTGCILSLITWIGLLRISCHSCQIPSVDGVCLVGHLCRADASQDHSRALQACIQGPPKDWRRRTWLRTVENDVQPLNFGDCVISWKRLHDTCPGNREYIPTYFESIRSEWVPTITR